MCIPLRADVVGGCTEGAANGGNDSVVGCTRASNGVTREGRKLVVGGSVGPTLSASISTSELTSATS